MTAHSTPTIPTHPQGSGRAKAAPHVAILTGTCTLALLAMLLVILTWSPGLDGIRMGIRATARTSLAFFLLAYAASALYALWPSVLSRWVLAHRRQWGWLLVISHTLHAAGLVAYMKTAPDLFFSMVPMATWITGGLAYAVIWSMGATSFDRTAAWLGRRGWAHLHTWGSHYIWLSFFLGNAKRIPMEPIYVLPTVPLVAVVLMRWLASRRRLKAGPTSVAPA
jgi:sulfoxide reductase heme-binding subunit YedZ